MNREKLEAELVCGRVLRAVTDRRSIFTDTPCFRQHSCQNEQTVFTAKVMSSPHTHHTTLHTHTDKSIYSFSYLVPSPSPLHTETLRPETKAQVEVDKRCLWIFWVTHSNRCLHSPRNYLLTDLILAVKWLAKSMCTQTGPESKVVHAVYLLVPSHTWYMAIAGLDRKLFGMTLQEMNYTNITHACIHTYTQKQT